MYSRGGFAEKLPPIHTLVCSNVPGPPIPLYVAGAQLKATYPFGPLTEGGGLNITVLSNMGNMDIGVIGCPDTVPDLDSIANGMVSAIAILKALAETLPDVALGQSAAAAGSGTSAGERSAATGPDQGSPPTTAAAKKSAARSPSKRGAKKAAPVAKATKSAAATKATNESATPPRKRSSK